MKEKKKDFRKIYNSSHKFYFDDIEELFNILSKSFSQIKISTDKYEDINSIDELKDITLKEVNFRTDNIKFSIIHDSIYFSVDKYEDEVKLVGLKIKIEEILKKTKRRISLLKNIFYEIIFLILFPSFIIDSISFIYSINEFRYFVPSIISLQVISIFIIKKFINKNNIFLLNKTRIKYSFYKDNKTLIDGIIITIFAFTLGKIF